MEFDYLEEAQKTKSSNFHGELVSQMMLFNVLHGAIVNLKMLDSIKKSLFYGKDNQLQTNSMNCDNINLAILHEDTSKAIDILHGIVGKATEAGELLEAIFESIFSDTPLDLINIGEELGDGQWYDAVIAKAIGTDFETIQTTNIDKLRARFPDKFKSTDAINRDLEKEREILESGLKPVDTP